MSTAPLQRLLESLDLAQLDGDRTLEELGSGFRIGAMTQVDRPIPEETMRATSQPTKASTIRKT